MLLCTLAIEQIMAQSTWGDLNGVAGSWLLPGPVLDLRARGSKPVNGRSLSLPLLLLFKLNESK